MDYLSSFTLYVAFFVSLYFEVFLLMNFLEKRSAIKTEEGKILKEFPSVTIIVPIFNEEKTATETIFSLLKLEYPKNKLRVIIVDDGSTDNTPNVIRRFGANRRIEIIRKKNGGKYTALNAGLAKVNSELVGCLDADSFVPPDTLKKIIPYFENKKTMAVTPAIKINRPNRFISHMQSNEYNLGIFIKKCFSLIDSVTVTPGPFSIFRTKVFENLGPFKEAHNTEDLEMAMRMQKNFYKITNAHTAIVYTTGPNSLKGLYKQRVRWISGFLKNMIDYRSIVFKKEHGHLGIFIIPAALASIGLFFVSTAMVLWNIFSTVREKIIEIGAIGFAWPNLRIDWFFIDMDPKMFLSLLVFIVTISFIMYGRKISENKTGLSIHTLYFPFIYAFFSIFWLSKSIYNAATSQKTNWR